EPPDKPTWAYAVAPGAQVAGAPRGGGRGAGGPGGGGRPGGAGAPGGAAGPGGPGGGGAPGARGGGRGGDPTPVTVPESKFSFTMAEVRASFGPADWFPEHPPPMPEIV